jgi:hypothetical protein
MVHTGTEHSAAIASHTLSDPRLLRTALDEGCTVIAAHAGMANTFDLPEHDFFPHLFPPEVFSRTSTLLNTHFELRSPIGRDHARGTTG